MFARTVFAVIFGGGKFWKAALRCVAMMTAACLLGWYFAQSTTDLSLRLQPAQLLCSSIFAVQLMTILGGVSALSVATSQSSLGRILQTLPLPSWQLWCITLMPSLTLSFICAPLVALPLWNIFAASHIGPWLSLVGILLGTTSGMGLLFGLPHTYRRIAIPWIGLVVCMEYKAVQSYQSAKYIPWLFIGFALSVSLMGLLRMLKPVSPNRLRSQKVWMLTDRVPYFVKKIVRAQQTRVSLGTTVALSIAITLFCRYQSITDVQTLSFLITLLISLSATDVRALCHRINPAEIVVLQGTQKFICSEFIATCFLSLAGTLPLVWYGIGRLGWTIISAVALGLAIGFPVGTLVMPQQRNISAQCIATLLCMATAIGISKLSFISEFNQIQLTASYLLLLVGILLLTTMTEYKRNPYRWSNYEHTKKH